jgi:hypothetical protein
MMYDVTTENASARDLELRERAVKQLKKRRDFRGHLLIYLLVNTFLVIVWAATSGPDGFFWPVFPIAGWGIGVIANWYDAYRGDDFTEESIEREMERMARRH